MTPDTGIHYINEKFCWSCNDLKIELPNKLRFKRNAKDSGKNILSAFIMFYVTILKIVKRSQSFIFALIVKI